MATISTPPGEVGKPPAGEVVRLDEWRKRRAGAGEDVSRQISANECLKLLNSIAPVPSDMLYLIGLPAKIYLLDAGEGSQPSISSAPDKGIAEVAAHIHHKGDFPVATPAYGIIVTSVGGNAFCTMLDSERRIVVSSQVRNIQDESGSWSGFVSDLRDALREAKSMAGRGERFRFVISSEGGLEVV